MKSIFPRKGIFGNQEAMLTPQEENDLARLGQKAREGKFETAVEGIKGNKEIDLDVYNEIMRVIDENNIELEEYHQDYINEIERFLDKNVRYETLREMYKDKLHTAALWAPTIQGYWAEMEGLFPDEHDKKLPTKGGWIMINKDIPVEEKLRPVKFGIYFAKGFWREDGRAMSVAKEGKCKFPNAGKRYMVRINTGASDVCLMPHEYLYVPDIKGILAEIGTSFEMIKLGGTPNTEEEKVHYLQTRGVPKEEIYMKMLNSVNSMNFCFFNPLPELIERLTTIKKGQFQSFVENFEAPKIEIQWEK